MISSYPSCNRSNQSFQHFRQTATRLLGHLEVSHRAAVGKEREWDSDIVHNRRHQEKKIKKATNPPELRPQSHQKPLIGLREVLHHSRPSYPLYLSAAHTFIQGFLSPAGRFTLTTSQAAGVRTESHLFSSGMFTHLAGLNPQWTNTSGTPR